MSGLEEWQVHISNPSDGGAPLCEAPQIVARFAFTDAGHWLASHHAGSRLQGCPACVRVILAAAQEQLGEAVAALEAEERLRLILEALPGMGRTELLEVRLEVTNALGDGGVCPAAITFQGGVPSLDSIPCHLPHGHADTHYNRSLLFDWRDGDERIAVPSPDERQWLSPAALARMEAFRSEPRTPIGQAGDVGRPESSGAGDVVGPSSHGAAGGPLPHDRVDP